MKHKKILPKHHTGRLVHRQHTSYISLVFLIMMGFLPLFILSREVAQASPTDPVTTNYSTYAVVPAQIPQTPPVILNPTQGSVITISEPVNVQGTCPNTTLIKVFKNDILAGGGFCTGGTFSIPIDLFMGSNVLVARAYNANNNVGPDSSIVTVRRDINTQFATNSTPTSTDKQFAITSDIQYKGINIGETFLLQLSLLGGTAPYAVSVTWGDGESDLISRNEVGQFQISHIYKNAGKGPNSSHNITVLAADISGTKSFLHLVTIVSGESPSVVGSIKAGYNWSQALQLAWQLIVIATLVVLIFWLGEKREAFILKRKIGNA